ncbi:MAG TPA: EAL domain-containing protein [Symbiobacteriaceae bacterium]|nr:EAL domain-containing protein [Symbiobacteriaceae bacterium]
MGTLFSRLDTRRLGFAVSLLEIGYAMVLYLDHREPWLTTLFLIGGVVLLTILRYGVPGWQRSLLVLVPAAPLLSLAYLSDNQGDGITRLVYVTLAGAVLLLPFRVSRADDEAPGYDLFELVHGFLSVLIGALMLLVPDRFPNVAFSTVRPYMFWLALLAFLGGAGLLAHNALRQVHPWLAHIGRGAAIFLTLFLCGTFVLVGEHHGALVNFIFGMALAFRPVLTKRPARREANPEHDSVFRDVEGLTERWTWMVITVALVMTFVDDVTQVREVFSSSYTVLALVAYNIVAFWLLPDTGSPGVRLRFHLYVFAFATAHLMLGGSPAAHGIAVASLIPPMLAARALGAAPGYGVLAANLGFVLLSSTIRQALWGWDGTLASIVFVRVVGILSAGIMVVRSAVEQRRLAQQLQAAREDLQAANEELTTQNEELTEAGQQLSRLAECDPLTGLVNRRRFQEVLSEEVARAEQGHTRGALFFLDLDHFKTINDTHGHAAGDRHLQMVARTLLSQVRDGDTVARLGGDEFAIVSPGSDAATARLTIERILQTVQASVGITLYPDSGQTVESLLIQADMAMYEVKRSGRNGYRIFEPRFAQSGSWEQEVRSAMADERLELHFQPIMSLQTRTVQRFEALLRLMGPDGQVVPPSAFLPHIEGLPVMHQVDRWVIKRALQQWQDVARTEAQLEVEINLSGRAFEDTGLLESIQTQLAASGVAAEQIIFEITETTAIADLARARAFIQTMRARGCRFAIDDLGSGFASFSYLKHLPVDYIKIDGSLIRDLREGTDQALVQGIVTIAKAMGIRTIAEWVEDEQTLQRLCELGVDYAQGYLIGHPKPLAAYQPIRERSDVI